MKPTEGLALGGRYRLVRQIAVGGMGEVWVAHDESLARDVAVKVLREEFAGNEDFLNRLRTEARNAAGLSHSNIAQLYDYGEQSGSGYLVMELIVGEPMSDLLEREPILPPRRLLPILSQAARGLHAAHVAGVVHRDVKPGNILLEHGRFVKITDFGVSLAANQVPMTATGMVMGTAQYLSPEQAIGKPATGASDVYALGIVAYESLVGHRPFTGATPVDIAVAHVNEEVPPLPSTVHVDLASLVMQMLDKDPQARPRSAAALAQLLDELAAGIEADPFGRARSGTGRHGGARPGGSPPTPPRATAAHHDAQATVGAPGAPAARRARPGGLPPVPFPESPFDSAEVPHWVPARVTPTPRGPAAAPAGPRRVTGRSRNGPPPGRRFPRWLAPLVLGVLLVFGLAAILDRCAGPDDGSAAAWASHAATSDVSLVSHGVADASSNGMISSLGHQAPDLGPDPTTPKDE